MNRVQSKIDIIRKILNEIEREDRFTEVFRGISVNMQRDYKDFSPEQICFDLIKQIVDQDDMPENVHSINIYVNPNDQIWRYEFVSFAGIPLNNDGCINIIWDE